MSGKLTRTARALAAGLVGSGIALTGGIAHATTPVVWFYAMEYPNLVKVGLQGNHLVQEKVLVKGDAGAYIQFTPVNSLGNELAGVKQTFNSTTHMLDQAVFTWDAKHSKMHLLAKPSAAFSPSPALYNGGATVACIDATSSTSKVMAMPANGGKASTVFTAPSGVVLTGLAVANDGKTFYVAEAKGGALPSNNSIGAIYRVVPKHTPVRLTTPMNGTQLTRLSLSPDGHTLAYGLETYPPSMQGLRLVSVATHGITRAINYQGRPATVSWSANGQLIYLSDEGAEGWFVASAATGHVSQIDSTSSPFMTMDPVRS